MNKSKPLKRTNLVRTANLSECSVYRYELTRTWDPQPDAKHPGPVHFVMLNPSKADAYLDDPTVRRCMGFADIWGYSAIHVVNLFGLRATNPRELPLAADPHGPKNEQILNDVLKSGQLIVAAWGANKFAKEAGRLFRQKAHNLSVPLHCIYVLGQGCPQHPLMAAYTKEPREFPAYRK